jgi:hypothetical protein
MPFIRFNLWLDTSQHGSPHQFKDAGVVADNLRGIHNEMMLRCQEELRTQEVLRVPTGKNPEDSNLGAWRPCSVSSSTYPSVMIGVC